MKNHTLKVVDFIGLLHLLLNPVIYKPKMCYRVDTRCAGKISQQVVRGQRFTYFCTHKLLSKNVFSGSLGWITPESCNTATFTWLFRREDDHKKLAEVMALVDLEEAKQVFATA